MNIAALIPMRHMSERVPQKNYRPFAGEPLFRHILNTMKACTRIDQIIVDTDSPIMSAEIQRDFPRVIVIERPAHLRDGRTPMNEVLRHDVTMHAADWYVQTHSTNPLLRPETVTRAIEALELAGSSHDSLFSVTALHKRFWERTGRPLNHDPGKLLRTQDLEPVLEENSCLYIFSRDRFLERGNRIGVSPLLFEMDRLEAWDLDDEFDFAVGEFLFEQQRARRAL
jgi:CMP-N-acetylneuraminic acid synthetase